MIIDFSASSAGDQIVLQNSAPAPFPGTPGVGVIPDVMRFDVVSESGDPGPLPETLRPLEVLLEEDAIRTREFVLRRRPEACTGLYWLINDLVWDDITEYPQLDTTEIWAFINRSSVAHPMHMHLDFFQVLDRQNFELIDGEVVPVGPRVPPPPEEAGWKDTVQANPFQITRVITRFEDFTGLYPYHCHVLEHEDHEMMRQFRVIPPCPADADGNGVVDMSDLIVVINAWGTDDRARGRQRRRHRERDGSGDADQRVGRVPAGVRAAGEKFLADAALPRITRRSRTSCAAAARSAASRCRVRLASSTSRR